MKNLLDLLKSLRPTIESAQDRDAAYLAGAVDICDLERRLRVIDSRGRGAWSPIAHGLYAC
jgi:hypothetical protein